MTYSVYLLLIKAAVQILPLAMVYIQILRKDVLTCLQK